MKIYLSGKVSDKTPELEEKNIEKFNSMTSFLRAVGLDICNPLEGEPRGDKWRNYLKRDLKKLMDCDAILLLRNWQDSPGALLELHNAKKLGYKIYFLSSFNNLNELIAELKMLG